MLTPKEYPSVLDKKPFEIKDSKGRHLFLAIVSMTMLSVSLYFMGTENKWTNIPSLLVTLLFLVSTFYSIKIFFKPEVIIKIDEPGIWTKKLGWIEWKDINYFYTKSWYSKGVNNVQFFIKTNREEKEVLIDLSFSEFANEGTIRRYIEIFRGDNKVIDLGNE